MADSPPIVGAALLGLDAAVRTRRPHAGSGAELSVAVDRFEANAVAGDPADAYLEVE